MHDTSYLLFDLNIWGVAIQQLKLTIQMGINYALDVHDSRRTIMEDSPH